MTISAFSHNSPFPDGSTPIHGADIPGRRPVRITDPGDLICAVPALLGFRPQRSFVAVCLSGRGPGTVGAVMRHDLVLGDGTTVSESMAAALDRFTGVCAREGTDAVVAVIVDDRIARGGGLASRGYVAIVDEFAARLDRVGTALIGVHATTEIEVGRQWFSLLGGDRCGTLPDPSASSVAVARVLDGGAIRASRRELEEVLSPRPAAERLRVAELIDTARESMLLGRELAERAGDRARADRRELSLVLAQIAHVESGGELLAAEIAELGLVLDNQTVRDCLLALAAGTEADAAEQLWVLLVRSLPDPERAQAAVLLGYSAYARGDGPMAGVALDAALESDPGHRLAGLLDTALQAGLRPAVVRELADTGYDCARRLGVDLPTPSVP